MENGHATDQELRDFTQFHLTVDQAHWVGKHLRVCAECNTRYQKAYQGKQGAPSVPKINVEAGAEVF